MKRLGMVCLWTALLTFATLLFPAFTMAQEESADAFGMNQRLGRGINMGNMLEAPREGQWGLSLEDEYFALVKQAGFDSVRIPIRWSAHAATEPPYEIDPPFLKRVDRAIEAALAQGLCVVVNVHHFNELYEDPPGEQARFLAIWRQLAGRYREHPDRLLLELLNEPHERLDADGWNELLAAALAEVRKNDPERYVVVGPAEWNGIRGLAQLKLPDDDRLIVTFHYYLPFHFTHQGASWVSGSEQWLGTRWDGSPQERQAVAYDLNRAADWARRNNRPLYLGEFGAYSRTDVESRARWTAFVRGEAERHAFSWAYWEFASGFGAFDPNQQQWRAPLLKALLAEDGP